MRMKISATSAPGGVLHNMSAPPRTRFESVVELIGGKFMVFQLAPPRTALTKAQLAGPVFRLGLVGMPSPDEVEAALRTLPAFLIGVKPGLEPDGPSCQLADTARAIAVLSRRVAEIYVRSRQPDYSAGHLFSQQPFTVESWEETE